MPETRMEQHPPRAQGAEAVVELSDARARKLRIWNFITAGVHLVCALVIFGITDQDQRVAIVTTYGDPDGRDGPGDWLPEVKRRTAAVVGYYSGVFLLLCFLDHFLVATLFRRSYENFLRHAQNPFRWIEYAISASVMRVQIAQLSGVMDINLLVAIFGLTATTMLFGLLQEQFSWMYHGRPREKPLRIFWLGCIPHVFAWAVVFSYFFHAVRWSDPPNFVWAIIFILFILDATFAVNLLLQQWEVSYWRDYIVGEYWFISLSLSSKLLLAWINFGGSRSL